MNKGKTFGARLPDLNEKFLKNSPKYRYLPSDIDILTSMDNPQRRYKILMIN